VCFVALVTRRCRKLSRLPYHGWDSGSLIENGQVRMKRRVSEGLISCCWKFASRRPERPVTCGQSRVGPDSLSTQYLFGLQQVAAKQQERLAARGTLPHGLAAEIPCRSLRRPGAPQNPGTCRVSLFRKWEKTSNPRRLFPFLANTSNPIDCFQNNPHLENNNTTSGPVPTLSITAETRTLLLEASLTLNTK
jgi:hypothetical protein